MEQSGQMVDCIYRDYSRYLERGGQLITHKKSTHNFPAKLHRMLENEQHSDVISWMPHGRAFKIFNKERFMSDVIPAYMSCNKFESFTRQLSGWGFKRLFKADGGNEGCYYHECFLRGVPAITCLIRRSSDGSQGKSSIRNSRQREPDFAAIARELPLPATTKESREKINGSGVPQRQMSVSFQISPRHKLASSGGKEHHSVQTGLCRSSGSGRSRQPPPPPTGVSLDIWSIFD